MNLGLNLALGNRRNTPGGPTLTAQQRLVALLGGVTAAGVYDLRTATDAGTLDVLNMAGTLASLRQSVAANKPAIATSSGLAFDGNNDRLAVTATGTYTVDLLMRKAAGSVTGHIISTLRLYTEANISGSSGTTVDGVVTATRGALFTALNDVAWHHVRFTGLVVAGTLGLGHTINSMAGQIMLCTAIPETTVTPEQLTAARAASAAWIASQRP